MDHDEDDATGTHQTGDGGVPSVPQVDPESQGEDRTISSVGDPSIRSEGHAHPEIIAHYRLGRAGRAIEVQKQAVTLLPEGESDLRTRLEEDLVNMENGSL